MSFPSSNGSAFAEARDAKSSGRQTQSGGEEGFSILELERAGLSEHRAIELGLPIDGTRHSALRHNVNRLKHYAG